MVPFSMNLLDLYADLAADYSLGLMKNFCRFLSVGAVWALTHSLAAQDLTFFFAAGNLSGEPDRFGNTHTVGPAEAIEPLPFPDDKLFNVSFDEDNKWLIYPLEGNSLLVSSAPGGREDSPEITMEITAAIAGKYEVILNFLDERNNPGSGPILAALGDDALMEYTENNATPATGGTAPGYPQIDLTTLGVMWWQSVSLGEVEVDAEGVIKVRIDDTTSDFGDEWITSTFQGITLRAIELQGTISEIQVSPGAFDWVTDVSGNQFKTGPLDGDLMQEDWLTVNANSNADNLWNIRQGLGSYGPILESFPAGGDDAPPLQTSVIFAQSGTYDVFVSLGDTGAVDENENLINQTPLNVGFEGEELTRWHPNDGEFKGTPGYNDYEVAVGEICVRAGTVANFIIDDVQDGTASRSVYLGMRFLRTGGCSTLPLQIRTIIKGEDNVTLRWASKDNASYIVEYAESLTDAFWIELDDGVDSEGEETSFVDEDAERVGKPTGYYRILVN